MSLQHEIKTKLAHQNSTSYLREASHIEESHFQYTAQLMGYNKKSCHKAALRIERLVADPQLNLYSSTFDFRYSNQEFLDTLCEVLGININDFNDEITAIHSHQKAVRDRFHSYIFIDTGFKRASQPIFMLACMENKRRIGLETEVQLQPVPEQIAYVQALVKQHFIDSEGTLPMWGDIQRYIFFYVENRLLSLNADGMVLEENPEVHISCATMTI